MRPKKKKRNPQKLEIIAFLAVTITNLGNHAKEKKGLSDVRSLLKIRSRSINPSKETTATFDAAVLATDDHALEIALVAMLRVIDEKTGTDRRPVRPIDADPRLAAEVARVRALVSRIVIALDPRAPIADDIVATVEIAEIGAPVARAEVRIPVDPPTLAAVAAEVSVEAAEARADHAVHRRDRDNHLHVN